MRRTVHAVGCGGRHAYVPAAVTPGMRRSRWCIGRCECAQR